MPKKMTDKISQIEKAIDATLADDENQASEDEDSNEDAPVLVEPDFQASSDGAVEKIDAAIASLTEKMASLDQDLQAHAAELQKQLDQIEKQIEEEKNRCRIQIVELTGAKKYLSGELL
ncbi:MAG: DUF5320 domain-containing protein [Chlamydiota bacterium]|nr:DUF5320 domain-containing protein [Chlamydiota bacterium]